MLEQMKSFSGVHKYPKEYRGRLVERRGSSQHNGGDRGEGCTRKIVEDARKTDLAVPQLQKLALE